jgi:PadR family transcriptional regulator PadR
VPVVTAAAAVRFVVPRPRPRPERLNHGLRPLAHCQAGAIRRLADNSADLQRVTAVIYNVETLAENLGTFEQAVLLSVAYPRTPLGRERYGRAILKEVQHRLQRDVAAGAVYATLDRLEEKRLISSWVAPGSAIRGGRPRRHYVIDPTGLRALHASRAATKRLWAGVRLPVKGSA